MRFRHSVLMVFLGCWHFTAQAAEWQILPGLTTDYVAQPTISAIAGISGTEGGVYPGFGAEISFNCPLLQPPRHRVREQLSYHFSPMDNDSVLHSVELNPHYIAAIAEGLSMGGGPALGMTAISGTGSDTAVGLGLGTSAHYTIDQFFAGGEFRYLYHFSDNINGNWRLIVKLGYHFP